MRNRFIQPSLLFLIFFSFFYPELGLFSRIIIVSALLLTFIFSSDDSRLTLNTLNFHFKCGILVFLSSLIALLVLLLSSPQKNLIIEYKLKNSLETGIIHYSPRYFELLPLQLKELLPEGHIESIQISGSFYLSIPVKKLIFNMDHGEARWFIDDQEYAYFAPDSPVDNLAIFKPLTDGYHTIKGFLSFSMDPPPTISILTALTAESTTFIPLPGPFYPPNQASNNFSIAISQILFSSFLALSLLTGFLILQPFLENVYTFHKKYPLLSTIPIIILLILCFSFIRLEINHILFNQYEADEAAFGMMSNSLLRGESPPFFHYGQNYQGTAESVLLSIFISLFGSSAESLHVLPQLWLLLFMLLSFFSFWFFIGLPAALIAMLFWSLGGVHFHWIFSKAWFGYSFTLFCGSCLWLITLIMHRRKVSTPGLALLWGFFAGIGFYALPIIAPFIISSFLSILLIPSRDGTHYHSPESRMRSFFHSLLHIVIHPFKNGSFYTLLFFILFSVPYWVPRFLNLQTKAITFLSSGRVLPQARVLGEHPLWDRFMLECLPALLGQRSPYYQQHDLISSVLSGYITYVFLISLLLYPFLCWRWRHIDSPLFSWRIGLPIWLFTLGTILLVSYSPFGVWPWYAIPLYWSIPFLITALLYCIWNVSSGLAVTFLFVLIVSIASGLHSYSSFYHQPLSISYTGISLPTDFKEVKNILKINNIRYVLCDQGYDVSDYGGRDWIGECLLYDSQSDLISVDRLTRRAPGFAYELMSGNQIAYLFHEDFYYNNPPDNRDEKYLPLTIDVFQRLFGPGLLEYKKYYIKPYFLYIPPAERRTMQKGKWKLDSSYPFMLSALTDHNISTRIYDAQAFWSSDRIPPSGAWIKVSFDKPKDVNRLVLFHGTKIGDIPLSDEVYVTNSSGERKLAGYLIFDTASRSSFIDFPDNNQVIEILIKVNKPHDDSWWTIFEMWIL